MKLLLVLAFIVVSIISTNCRHVKMDRHIKNDPTACRRNCKRDEIEDDIIPRFEDIEERYSAGHQRWDERQRRIESDLRSCGFNCKRDEIKRKRHQDNESCGFNCRRRDEIKRKIHQKEDNKSCGFNCRRDEIKDEIIYEEDF